MDGNLQNAWNTSLKDPLGGRLDKPRSAGLTMVIDKGLGLASISDLLEVNSQYIDFIKFSFGTALIYPEKILLEKIKLIKEYQIDVYAGGTLFEVAITQDSLSDYLHKARSLGFTTIEISNGTIYLSPQLRKEAISKAKSMGFKVLTEVGKKDRHNTLSLEDMKKQIEADLTVGADNIIIEGRESGKAISIYDAEGNVNMDMLRGIMNVVKGSEEILIWETPLKSQQAFFINELGSNVSLGNIQTGDVLALEALRRGLRGDTFKLTLENEFVDNNKADNNKESNIGA